MAAVETDLSFMQDVEDSDLDAILAGARAHGVYSDNLLAYMHSGRRGVEINLADGPHKGKKAASVKTGYESAIKRLKEGKLTGATDEDKAAADSLQVVSRNDRVFLARKDMAAAA